MKNEILEFLSSFTDDHFHEINQFLKEKFGNESLEKIRRVLYQLSDSKPPLIEVAGQTYSRLGLHTPNIHPEHNVVADLDNWPVRARITDKGRTHLSDQKKEWYETENVRRQYEDYSNIRKEARLAIKISVAAVIITLLIGVLQLTCSGRSEYQHANHHQKIFHSQE